MKFVSHIIVIASNNGCYMFYGKGTEPNKRRLDLQIIQLESYVGHIIKGCGYERNKKYMERNTSDLNAVIQGFRAGAQPYSEKNLLSV